jgi:hypothetical protein
MGNALEVAVTLAGWETAVEVLEVLLPVEAGVVVADDRPKLLVLGGGAVRVTGAAVVTTVLAISNLVLIGVTVEIDEVVVAVLVVVVVAVVVVGFGGAVVGVVGLTVGTGVVAAGGVVTTTDPCDVLTAVSTTRPEAERYP